MYIIIVYNIFAVYDITVLKYFRMSTNCDRRHCYSDNTFIYKSYQGLGSKLCSKENRTLGSENPLTPMTSWGYFLGTFCPHRIIWGKMSPEQRDS